MSLEHPVIQNKQNTEKNGARCRNTGVQLKGLPKLDQFEKQNKLWTY